MLSVNDRVVVADKQLHGNSSVLVDGAIVSIEGSSATVMVDGEDVPRQFKLAELNSGSEVYGYNANPNDNQVIDAIRRHI
jgi:hypothetical protein